MTIIEDMEKWARLLPPTSEKLPSVLKVTMPTYSAMFRETQLDRILESPLPNHGRFDGVRIRIVEDLEVPWIMYDQHGEEMKRAS